MPLSVTMPSFSTQWPFSNEIDPDVKLAVCDVVADGFHTTSVPGLPSAPLPPSLTSSKSFWL